ncbi:MAG: hypothetical protein IJT16_15375 [Lachnospiraceae bacterium]|nr:hypothetical protein [Lachnospiraceae bacterium]
MRSSDWNGEQPVFPPFSDPFGTRMEQQIFETEKSGNLELACKTCEEAYKYFPEDLRFLYRLTILRRRLGHTGKAIKSAEALVKKEPDNKWFFRELAISCMERGYTRKAYSAFYRAYDLGIRDTDFLTLYARECYDYGQFERGITLITDVFAQRKQWDDDIPELIDLMMSLFDMTICIGGDNVPQVIKLITEMVEENRAAFPEYAAQLRMIISVFERNYDADGSWHAEYLALSKLLISLAGEAASSQPDKASYPEIYPDLLEDDIRLDQCWYDLAAVINMDPFDIYLPDHSSMSGSDFQ